MKKIDWDEMRQEIKKIHLTDGIVLSDDEIEICIEALKMVSIDQGERILQGSFWTAKTFVAMTGLRTLMEGNAK
jgi:hypothetical protein